MRRRKCRGEEFKYDFNRLEKAVTEIKQQINQVGKKLTADQMLQVRNNLTKNIKFAAGVLSAKNKALLKTDIGTVWLSDDTLIKQFDSRKGQKFEFEEYIKLPDILNTPELILPGKQKAHYEFHKIINSKKYIAVIKVLKKEIFLQSFRRNDGK